ncbi:MAG: hypothetical protein RTV72_11990 [Candidatus Thorarchaeota archaeon]
MYKRYEPSERIFVDREERHDWMDTASTRCKEKSVVLHLKGICGIGKSSQWKNQKKSKKSFLTYRKRND